HWVKGYAVRRGVRKGGERPLEWHLRTSLQQRRCGVAPCRRGSTHSPTSLWSRDRFEKWPHELELPSCVSRLGRGDLLVARSATAHGAGGARPAYRRKGAGEAGFALDAPL